MQIVTDSGTDICLPSDKIEKYNIHIVPLNVNVDGETYREGKDIELDDFYQLLKDTGSYPTTSQPSAGDFAEVYRELALQDPDILSIHMSSGLSGTFNSAQAGAELVPEANITLVDTKTLSAAAGWQVEAAAKAILAGWSIDQILPMIKKIGEASESVYTLKELKYLIHGGRISHMKGLVASLLNIKPMIGVEKVNGTYVQLGQTRTFKRAIKGLVDIIAKQHSESTDLRVQVLHSHNPEGAHMLLEQVEKRFNCTSRSIGALSLVLGAHTGPSMIGVAYAPATAFEDIP